MPAFRINVGLVVKPATVRRERADTIASKSAPSWKSFTRIRLMPRSAQTAVTYTSLRDNRSAFDLPLHWRFQGRFSNPNSIYTAAEVRPELRHATFRASGRRSLRANLGGELPQPCGNDVADSLGIVVLLRSPQLVKELEIRAQRVRRAAAYSRLSIVLRCGGDR